MTDKLEDAVKKPFEQEEELEKLEEERQKLSKVLVTEEKKWDGPEPVLHDYVNNSQVEIEDAIIEEGEGDGIDLSPNAEAGEVQLSPATTGNAVKRAYYQIPFADGLKRAVDPAQRNQREPVFVSETPEVFRKIGFTALPMMMNVRHLRLNYYSEQEFQKNFGKLRDDENAHGLHTYLNGLPNALKYPLAVVANLTENAKSGSVVAITNMDVAGKKVVVPVLIEATSNVDGNRIDSHLVLTVYDSKDWREKFLRPAMEAEKTGIGVFYFDPKKAGQYGAYSLKLAGRIPSGYAHNINDQGSPVKGNFKKQSETLQFWRWFGDSKVVDADGKPLVVYHGTRGIFFVFDNSKSGSNLDFGTMGKGFYFTTDMENAENIARNNTTGNGDPTVMKCFLSIQNPKEISWNEISGDDQQEAERLTKKWMDQGYDGFVADAPNGAKWYVAFSPEQIKSATDNIGTFDRNNPDIRLSPATPEEAKEASDEVFGSEKDGIVNRIWDVAKIWKSPVAGEKKDVSAGASVLKNFYYQGKDVPTLGRVFEGGLRIDEFKNQAEHYMFNGNSGHDTLAEFAAWKKNNAAEYKRLNDYMVKTDMDRKADHVCRVAENSKHKWEVIAGDIVSRGFIIRFFLLRISFEEESLTFTNVK